MLLTLPTLGEQSVHQIEAAWAKPKCDWAHNLKRLENHLIAVAKGWTNPEKVRSTTHSWMLDQANAGAPT